MVALPALIFILIVGNRLLVSDTDTGNIPTAKVKSGQVVIKITETGELRAQFQAIISAVNR